MTESRITLIHILYSKIKNFFSKKIEDEHKVHDSSLSRRTTSINLSKTDNRKTEDSTEKHKQYSCLAKKDVYTSDLEANSANNNDHEHGYNPRELHISRESKLYSQVSMPNDSSDDMILYDFIIPSNQERKNRARLEHKKKKKSFKPEIEISGNGYKLKVYDTVCPNPIFTNKLHKFNYIDLTNNGNSDQIAKRQAQQKRELVIGLDFGTSSVKVVVGDKVLGGPQGTAFAIPFFHEHGISSYLLPSRVWLNNDIYSLIQKGTPYRNLKLLLIDNNCSVEDFSHAAAFLALVIQHTRSWIFFKHHETYCETEILWKLSLGLPAANYLDEVLVERFKKLAAAAWIISLKNPNNFNKENINNTCSIIWNQPFYSYINNTDELKMLDIDVVPEISAQIYGFLISTKFDPNAKNIFMIIDIGAGTIDSTVFQVKVNRGKKFSFTSYGHTVELNGVVSLHKSRISWLKSTFLKHNILNNQLDNLIMMQNSTDFIEAFPENIGDYFSGVDLFFSKEDKNPDYLFFRKSVREQILVRTLKESRKFFHTPSFAAGMSVFLCGGGSRMGVYKQLEDIFENMTKNVHWKYFCRKLEVPDSLQAPGIRSGDFDRLSVAYGLSFVSVGKFAKGAKIPSIIEHPSYFHLGEHDISKDMV